MKRARMISGLRQLGVFPLFLCATVAGCSSENSSGGQLGRETSTAVTGVVWGVNGHPEQPDYRSWDPDKVTEQLNAVHELGAQYYRISSEQYRDCPSCLLDPLYSQATAHVSVPRAKELGIVLLPILVLMADTGTCDPNLPCDVNVFQANYDVHYARGQLWANYALHNDLDIPVWELGNEPEVNFPMSNDGSSESDWPDNARTEATIGGLHGLYWGVRRAYEARNKSVTSIGGAAWVHWGFLEKMSDRLGGVLPYDKISWHWYEPAFDSFDTYINHNHKSASESLAAFGKDIWITEVNRQGKETLQDGSGTVVPTGGSCTCQETPWSCQSWGSEADDLASTIDDLGHATDHRPEPSLVVKAIFAYELYDETSLHLSDGQLCSEGFYGLMTTNTTTYEHSPKNAYWTFRDKIAGL